MKQSRLMSFVESGINIVVGLGVAMLANWIILPLLGFAITFADNAIIAAFMTAVSLVRSFALRRLFEALHIRRPISPFALAVLAERQRQVDGEGWTAEHDDQHEPGEMAAAGAAYALNTRWRRSGSAGVLPLAVWPWSSDWWRPTTFRRDLVKSAALIIAEGERHDRARKTSPRRGDAATVSPQESPP